MLSELKNQQSDRQKVEKWLNHIHEFDQAARDEVINQCKTDHESRMYFVKRHDEECK